jgi:hypothetical protein
MARRYTKGDSRKKDNPARSGKQYRLAQAVLAGYSEAMPKRVARELIEATSQEKRSEYMRGRKKTKNSGKGVEEFEKARELAEGFHGRPARDIEDIIEIERYRTKLAKLGDLIELEVLCKDGDDVIPIAFASEENDSPEEDFVSVSSTPDRRQILFVAGNQIVDLSEFDSELTENELSKDYVCLGECFSISYWTDKHHLEGPEYQKEGTSYIHKFGEEEGGERPTLVYDRLNERLLLVGGSYEIRDEGIYN